MQHKITTIFFDLFGVLLVIDQSVVIQYLSKLTDTPYIETREIALGEPFMRLERGEVTFSRYVEDIRSTMPNGSRIDADSLREIWKNSKVGEMPAVSLLHVLQKKIQVWVISNTTESHIKSLKSKFSFLSQLNGIITSEKAGAHKPNAKIFHYALTEAGTDISASIFIDDSRLNVESAEILGIKSFHYTSFSTLVDYLKRWEFVLDNKSS